MILPLILTWMLTDLGIIVSFITLMIIIILGYFILTLDLLIFILDNLFNSSNGLHDIILVNHFNVRSIVVIFLVFIAFFTLDGKLRDTYVNWLLELLRDLGLIAIFVGDSSTYSRLSNECTRWFIMSRI